MRLSQEQAQRLVNSIRHRAADKLKENEIEANKQWWQGEYDAFSRNIDSGELEGLLSELRNELASRDSVVIDIAAEEKLAVAEEKKGGEEKKAEESPIQRLRVFPAKTAGSILLDDHTIFGRGIDAARGVLAIFKAVSDDATLKEIEGTLKSALKVFHTRIQQCNEDPLRALDELKRFNGALCSFLVQKKVCPSFDAARASLQFATDFVFKQTWKNESFCTLTPVPHSEGGMLIRVATPITTPQRTIEVKGEAKEKEKKERTIEVKGEAEEKEKKEKEEEKKYLTLSVQNSWWYEDCVKKFGGWFQQFYEKNFDDLQTLSLTPANRRTPNLANAYDSSLIAVDGIGAVTQVNDSTHVAITEPYEMRDSDEVTNSTCRNHMDLVVGQKNARLLDIVQTYFAANDIRATPYVKVPILNQTLIGSFIPPLSWFMPDQKKSTTALDNKEIANARLRNYLNQIEVYRKSDGTIEIYDKGNAPREYKNNPQICRVEFMLLETNNCVNAHHKMARVSNDDINHARTLVGMAKDRLLEVKSSLSIEQQGNLQAIIDFLDSRDHSIFTPYKSRGNKVKAAVTALSQYLRDPQSQINLSSLARNNLALLIQAATELKCTVHETWGGALRRRINNAVEGFNYIPLLGPYVITPVIRLVMWLVAQALKVVTIIPMISGLVHWFKHHNTRRPSVHKATNERLVTAALGGEHFGGCMSSADRAEEIEAQTQAQLRAFNDPQLGHILGFNDDPSYKKWFLRQYGSAQEMHNFDLMATGSPVSNMGESLPWVGRASGLVSEEETARERRLFKGEFSKLRKLKKATQKGVDIASYIREGAQARLQVVGATDGKMAAIVKQVSEVESKEPLLAAQLARYKFQPQVQELHKSGGGPREEVAKNHLKMK